ncbi:MAG: ThiF family adenylyltransferase [Phycisphaerales bacterium]
MSDATSRYRRQAALPILGEEGQRRIQAGHVLVVGCGALGSVAVELLARAGVGTLTVVDRDVVEWTNLQRQLLFDEDDARRATPKAEAAKARVARINADVRVRAFWDDLGPRNAVRYAEGVDVIVDGLDNIESRYLLNDLAVSTGTTYVYGAAVGTVGMCAVVRPGATPCLRCMFPEPPHPGSVATCDTVGVLGTATAIVASLEVTQAIKILAGAADSCERRLVSLDVWSGEYRAIDRGEAPDPQCPCCGRRNFEFLNGERIPQVTTLCGANAVQIAPRRSATCDLDAIAARLEGHATIERRDGAIRAAMRDDAVELTVFVDGRVVVRGTTEPDRARALVARYVGT